MGLIITPIQVFHPNITGPDQASSRQISSSCGFRIRIVQGTSTISNSSAINLTILTVGHGSIRFSTGSTLLLFKG